MVTTNQTVSDDRVQYSVKQAEYHQAVSTMKAMAVGDNVMVHESTPHAYMDTVATHNVQTREHVAHVDNEHIHLPGENNQQYQTTESTTYETRAYGNGEVVDAGATTKVYNPMDENTADGHHESHSESSGQKKGFMSKMKAKLHM